MHRMHLIDNNAGIKRIRAMKPGKIARGNIAYIYTGAGGDILATSAQTLLLKQWKLPPELTVDPSIVDAAESSQLLAKLLLRRGLNTPAAVKAFLDPSHFTPSSPLELADMPRAVARIGQAIANKEKVTIY